MFDGARLAVELCCGKNLAPEVRQAILDEGLAIAPLLVEILVHEELAAESAPGEGYAPIHAAELLGELRADIAIEPMLTELAATDWNDHLHHTLHRALRRFGAALVEPALRAYDASESTETRASFVAVLAACGARDERIFERLIGMLPTAPDHAAGLLAEYGDRRAVVHLARAFDAHRLERDATVLSNQTLIELRAAIEDLGGALTLEQEATYAVAMEPRDRWRAQLDAALTPATRRPRPGRNEPCWCGSAKKYKRCHLDVDEQTAHG